MNFILASSNPHKAEELSEFLKDSKITIKSSDKKLEVVEDGESFEENAFKKAEAYFNEFKVPVLSDDSGLIVDARKDILGVHSARFAPEFSEYSGKNKKLIEILKEQENKQAEFVCILCAYISKEEVYFFEGRLKGVIAPEIMGEGGFGYDPVFIPNKLGNESLAQRPDWKKENSHRVKALQQLSNFFNT